MEKGLLTLQSAEMFSRRALRIAVGVTGWNVKAIQQPQPVLKVHWRLGRPGLRGQGRPETAEGVAPDLLPQRQVESLESFLGCLMGSETGPFVAA